MKSLKPWLFGGAFPAIYVVVVSVAGYKHFYAFPFVGIIFFLMAAYMSKNWKGQNTLSAFWKLNWLFTMLLFVSTFTGGFPSSGVYLVTSWVMSMLGLRYTRTSYKLAYISLVIFFSLAGGSYFIPALDFAYHNRHAHRTFEHPELQFLTRDYDTVQINPEVITVLDNWHVFCGACFKKFPELNAMYKEYADHPEVEIYALNSPQRLDHPDSVRALMAKLNYDFPDLYATDTKALQETFGFNAYPHMLILKGGKVYYSGFFSTKWNEPFADPRHIIDQLLGDTYYSQH